MSSEKLDNKRHTLAHLLAMAVLEYDPEAKLGIGPTIENGFYYDFELTRPITDKELPKLQKTMKSLIKKRLTMEGLEVSASEAKKVFENQPFKIELIEEYSGENKQLTTYKLGTFIDLCKGGHVENTSEIDPDSFTLTHTAGAYWRGDESKPMLTRIYGAAFQDKTQLDEHLKRLEEAKKRDHRKLGIDLDLFTFSELVGPGLPLFTPKGTILRDVIDDYIWNLRKDRGYERVDIPHITKKDLFVRSGHWDKFGDALFRITTREKHEFAIKPMNCPFHTQIYARRPHSYRELPVRYANTTKVYRDEQTGELAGISRVRSITQDDAHVFCRESQIFDEITSIYDIIETFYGRLGFELSLRLSLHDPATPEKYSGTPEVWKKAESTLREFIKQKGISAIEKIGEAAFYGPKLDFIANDSMGREWQVATTQLDMNLPEKFDLTVTNEKGEKERVVMIHAAIAGSLERLLAVLIEHYAGAFPFWLAPVQVKILTVNEHVIEYANSIKTALTQAGYRVESDSRNESIGKKIREGELQKIPALLIIGEKEAEGKLVSLRMRGEGDVGKETTDKLLSRFASYNV